jgi:hypothetical protein
VCGGGGGIEENKHLYTSDMRDREISYNFQLEIIKSDQVLNILMRVGGRKIVLMTHTRH